jgi:hypothetical protein
MRVKRMNQSTNIPIIQILVKKSLVLRNKRKVKTMKEALKEKGKKPKKFERKLLKVPLPLPVVINQPQSKERNQKIQHQEQERASVAYKVIN